MTEAHPQNEPIRVVVVDDSALMRQVISRLLNEAPDIEVVDTAQDPHAARQLIKTHNPDVLTLDIEMANMDGLTFLEKLMTLRPMPVVMVSSLTQEGSQAALRALELGAVDFVGKPNGDLRRGMENVAVSLVEKVRAAARAQVKPLHNPRPAAPPALTRPLAPVHGTQGYRAIGIGASTGGVEAIYQVVSALPPGLPGILVVQHMPGGFTRSFAKRLDALSQLTVMEAEDGMPIHPGHVYIAPGTHHLIMAQEGGQDVCYLGDGPPTTGHRPSVDELFNSIAATAGKQSIGVILTGMGKDGAQGLRNMRRLGAPTIGQDEASSVVYGMPRAAFELGAVAEQVTLDRVAETIQQRATGEMPLREGA
jgi:two-component system chemotaxis response regulator CheB